MSVLYKLGTNKIKSSKSFGKWFARVRPVGTKTIEDMSEVIQRNCSMKRSDILAVLSEFSEVLSGYLLDGYRVKITGLGAFKVGIKSRGALDPTSFTVQENVKGAKVSFTPEKVWNATAKKYTAKAVDGVQFVNVTQMASDAEMTKRKESLSEKENTGA